VITLIRHSGRDTLPRIKSAGNKTTMAQQSLLAASAAGTPSGTLSAHATSNGTAGRSATTTNGGPGSDGTPKPAIERGASWSYNETRILLSLWGQDMVQRQLTNSKRTRHVWEKIAERIKEHGYERTPGKPIAFSLSLSLSLSLSIRPQILTLTLSFTSPLDADQVRTRVFNMIAEYRRILKNPTAERKKKCIFFDALHKIYQAKDASGVRAALSNYEEELNLEPLEFAPLDEQSGYESKDLNDAEMMDAGSGSDAEERSEIFSYAMSPSQLNGFSSFSGMNGSVSGGNANPIEPGSPTRINQLLDTLSKQLRFVCRSTKRSSSQSFLFEQVLICVFKLRNVIRQANGLRQRRSRFGICGSVSRIQADALRERQRLCIESVWHGGHGCVRQSHVSCAD
jgi:hypothetical protein